MRRWGYQRVLLSSISKPLSNTVSKPSHLLQELRRFPHEPHRYRRCLYTQQHNTASHSSRFHSKASHKLLEASYTSYVIIVALACGGAILIKYISNDKTFGDRPENSLVDVEKSSKPLPPSTSIDPFFTDMPVPPGHRGNLTADQEAKLRQLWEKTFKVFGVHDPSQPNGKASLDIPHDETPTASEGEGKEKKRKKSRVSLFGRKHDDSSSDPSKASADDDDKYGQVKEFQQILATQSPESLRSAFWEMVKADHPDALLLRFLRARKWDVDKALVMMISTMAWRREIHVDDDVMFHGEGGALADSKSGDASTKREGDDFLAQLRLGKSFLHGTDKEGRPLCFVRVRLHHAGDQSEKSLERYTVYVIETARLALRTPVETACIVFDMTHFTMSNMDYTPVKFMIKIFEANYPESLGAVLVHHAPWIFQGIWKIIRGWLDPVVASKVHFTSSVDDLEQFIPRSQIIKELGGDENWEYHYVEPVPGEDNLLKEGTDARKKLQEERNVDVLQYQNKTFEWIASGSGEKSGKLKEERDVLANKLNENYWQLDPYIRARTLYDRIGMIEKGGKINFYPSHNKTVNGPAQTNADDVD